MPAVLSQDSELRPTGRRAHWRTRSVLAGTIAALGLSLLAAMPATADPTDPTTSSEAQQAWVESTQRAGALNEQVLVAQETAAAAATQATAAGDEVIRSRDAATAAAAAAVAADATAASFQDKVNAFANASFRGARLSSFSVMLTADSADDFLDQVTSLDRVAADTRQTLDAALAAKAEAATAQANAQAAQAAAEAAKTQADAAKAAADEAAADVTARKADLDAEAARYKALYDTLSEQERQAAIAAREAELEAQAAAAAAASEEAAAQAAPAEAPAAANRSRTRTDAAPNEQAAQAPAPASQATQAPKPEPVAAPSGSGAASVAVAAALSKQGAPYVYGAAGPNSFDCSGLTSWAWKQAGVSIPRTSSGQSGLPVVPLSQLQPGDLVTYYSPVSHVAMYIGGGQIIHASTPSKPVYITSVSGGGPNPVGHRVTG